MRYTASRQPNVYYHRIGTPSRVQNAWSSDPHPAAAYHKHILQRFHLRRPKRRCTFDYSTCREGPCFTAAALLVWTTAALFPPPVSCQSDDECKRFERQRRSSGWCSLPGSPGYFPMSCLHGATRGCGDAPHGWLVHSPHARHPDNAHPTAGTARVSVCTHSRRLATVAASGVLPSAASQRLRPGCQLGAPL